MLVGEYSVRPEDSLKKEAALFFKEHLASQYSEVNDFRDEISGEPVVLDWDRMEGEVSIAELIAGRHLALTRKQVPDAGIVTNEILKSHIESYDLYMRKWAWNRKADRRTLHNYLLAYKVFREEPGAWREYFIEAHNDYLKKVLASRRFGLGWFGENPTQHAIVLMDMANNWFTYEDAGMGGNGSLSFPLMKCVRKGNCYFGAYTGVYILRSFGIPAALDIVPCWGSRNGGHAEVAALDSNGKMGAIPRHQLVHAAKVFRLGFLPVNIWRDSIRPLIEKDSFMLPAIAHDYWEDATADHTGAGDIETVMPGPMHRKLAYICAFNYGEWQPVYWGKVNAGGAVAFRQMGKDVLYCTAWPEGKGLRLAGRPFVWDSSGRQQVFSPDTRRLVKMKLTKLNTGARAWVEKGRAYTLYYLGAEGEWLALTDVRCERDAVLPEVEAPAGGIYRLVDKHGDGRLERPFEYREGQQVWR
ncbi:hypothetical protein ACQKLP_23865 [Chitinophaga sp. NPDC101104]|uniref:hypothetical protein n=1 Tax=Chitinophaga sp. NPDC101104 TaxID=3390561 RepID=UPI003D017EB3